MPKHAACEGPEQRLGRLLFSLDEREVIRSLFFSPGMHVRPNCCTHIDKKEHIWPDALLLNGLCLLPAATQGQRKKMVAGWFRGCAAG